MSQAEQRTKQIRGNEPIALEAILAVTCADVGLGRGGVKYLLLWLTLIISVFLSLSVDVSHVQFNRRIVMFLVSIETYCKKMTFQCGQDGHLAYECRSAGKSYDVMEVGGYLSSMISYNVIEMGLKLYECIYWIDLSWSIYIPFISLITKLFLNDVLIVRRQIASNVLHSTFPAIMTNIDRFSRVSGSQFNWGGSNPGVCHG